MADSTNQSAQVAALATRIGNEIKATKATIGTLTSLSTTDKTSAVAAVNEVLTSLNATKATVNDHSTRLTNVESKASTNASDISTAKTNITSLQGKVSTVETEIKTIKGQIASATNIDDTKTSLTTTFSSTKIASDIEAAKNAVKNDLLNGAGEAYDTLKELGDLIDTNKSAIDALKDTAAGHVRFNAAQTLTDPQKKQARTNIGAADATTVSDHATRLTAVEKKAGDTETVLNALKAAVGDTTTDYVAAFEAALNDTE